MSVYFLANSKIVDRELLEEYQECTRPILGAVAGAELIIADNCAEVLEGEPAGTRVIVVKFESEESFRAFYDSPEYQSVIGKRLQATDGFAILAEPRRLT
jgi:uncharacterized protein (DUF1330 family)